MLRCTRVHFRARVVCASEYEVYSPDCSQAAVLWPYTPGALARLQSLLVASAQQFAPAHLVEQRSVRYYRKWLATTCQGRQHNLKPSRVLVFSYEHEYNDMCLCCLLKLVVD